MEEVQPITTAAEAQLPPVVEAVENDGQPPQLCAPTSPTTTIDVQQPHTTAVADPAVVPPTVDPPPDPAIAVEEQLQRLAPELNVLSLLIQHKRYKDAKKSAKVTKKASKLVSRLIKLQKKAKKKQQRGGAKKQRSSAAATTVLPLPVDVTPTDISAAAAAVVLPPPKQRKSKKPKAAPVVDVAASVQPVGPAVPIDAPPPSQAEGAQQSLATVVDALPTQQNGSPGSQAQVTQSVPPSGTKQQQDEAAATATKLSTDKKKQSKIVQPDASKSLEKFGFTKTHSLGQPAAPEDTGKLFVGFLLNDRVVPSRLQWWRTDAQRLPTIAAAAKQLFPLCVPTDVEDSDSLQMVDVPAVPTATTTDDVEVIRETAADVEHVPSPIRFVSSPPSSDNASHRLQTAGRCNNDNNYDDDAADTLSALLANTPLLSSSNSSRLFKNGSRCVNTKYVPLPEGFNPEVILIAAFSDSIKPYEVRPPYYGTWNSGFKNVERFVRFDGEEMPRVTAEEMINQDRMYDYSDDSGDDWESFEGSGDDVNELAGSSSAEDDDDSESSMSFINEDVEFADSSDEEENVKLQERSKRKKWRESLSRITFEGPFIGVPLQTHRFSSVDFVQMIRSMNGSVWGDIVAAAMEEGKPRAKFAVKKRKKQTAIDAGDGVPCAEGVQDPSCAVIDDAEDPNGAPPNGDAAPKKVARKRHRKATDNPALVDENGLPIQKAKKKKSHTHKVGGKPFSQLQLQLPSVVQTAISAAKNAMLKPAPDDADGNGDGDREQPLQQQLQDDLPRDASVPNATEGGGKAPFIGLAEILAEEEARRQSTLKKIAAASTAHAASTRSAMFIIAARQEAARKAKEEAEVAAARKLLEQQLLSTAAGNEQQRPPVVVESTEDASPHAMVGAEEGAGHEAEATPRTVVRHAPLAPQVPIEEIVGEL